jgi:hypothetical protein
MGCRIVAQMELCGCVRARPYSPSSVRHPVTVLPQPCNTVCISQLESQGVTVQTRQHVVNVLQIILSLQGFLQDAPCCYA